MTHLRTVIFGGKIWQLENILLVETKKQAQKILKTIKPDLRKKNRSQRKGTV